jgi:hypothetical protein
MGLCWTLALQLNQPKVNAITWHTSTRSEGFDKTTVGLVKVQFGIGSAASIGSLAVNTLIGVAEFHIIEADTQFLICLKDIDDLKAYFNNLKNVLIREHDKRTFPVVRKFGHPFVVWGPITINYLTETELRRLPRQ